MSDDTVGMFGMPALGPVRRVVFVATALVVLGLVVVLTVCAVAERGPFAPTADDRPCACPGS